MKIGIIDGDSLCYISSKESINESISNIDSLLTNIINYNNLTHYYIFLSRGKYFRHNVNSEYKAKRPIKRLKYLKTLQEYLIEHWGALHINLIEADDMVAYLARKYTASDTNFVVCAIDKDVTKQVPGNHFNYKTFKKSKTTSEEAYRFLMLQTLMGDSTDNITGIPGVGEVTASKLLESKNINELASIVLNEYIKYYKTISDAIYHFQMNFRQVYLLNKDSDFINEIGCIPEIPEPIQIINNNV